MTQVEAVQSPMEFVGALADRAAWRTDACPAAATLDVVGSRSAMLIMREALYGTTRFDDFVQRVGVTETVAAARLRELTDLGLLMRTPYREPGQRTRYEYRLSAMGADFAPVVHALFEWGATHLRDGHSPFAFEHRDCGAQVRTRLTCDAGHDVAVGDVRVRRTRKSRSA